jgi:MYXO-CTERM domain-containing protein
VNNLAASPNGPFSPDLVLNPAGSPGLQLDGYTVPLTFAGPLVVGSNVLEVRVADVGDSIIDSAVFLEGGTLGSGPILPPPGPGPGGPGPVIPAPPAAVLAAVAGLVLVRRRS